jgi:hypothetical protein
MVGGGGCWEEGETWFGAEQLFADYLRLVIARMFSTVNNQAALFVSDTLDFAHRRIGAFLLIWSRCIVQHDFL